MWWAIRIVSGLCVVTFGYIWTVGQGGFDAANRNLCDLWADTFGPPPSCQFNKYVLWLWGLGALLAVIFLALDFIRWLRRRPASEFKGIGQIGGPTGTYRPTTNEMPPQFQRGRWWYAIWAGAPFHFYKARKRLEFIDSWEKFYAERAKSAVAPPAYVPSEKEQPISPPIVPRRARIVFGTGHPFETVAPAGKNQNRTVRVKIENVTDAEIANGTVSILNLDPPQNEHKNFF
jgi:hypothetical protein